MNGRRCRDREEIIREIIRSAARKEGTMKTRIMYEALLSYTQLTEYLNFLIGNGLLEYDRASKLYYTTGKGFELLELYNRLDNIAFLN